MRRISPLLVAALLAVLAAPAAVAAPAAEFPAEWLAREAVTVRSPGVFDREAQFQRQLDLQQRLAAQAASRGLAAPLTVEISAERLQQMEQRQPFHRKLRVGVAEPVGRSVVLGGVAERGAQAAGDFGARQATAAGWVWTGSVRVPGASALRLHFTGVDLPAGAELYVYNLAGEAHGPYRGQGRLDRGEIWAHAVSGEEVTIQLHVAHGAKRPARFTLAEVGYLGESFPTHMVINPRGRLDLRAFCSGNEPCVEDANCHNVGAVADAKDAAARMLFQSGGFLFLCSGGLLTDTAGSQTPYFLTAYHCISKNNEAASLQTFFQYETASCGASCPAPGSASTVGATILAKDRGTDFTLMQLAENPPGGSAFLGWTSAPVAFTDGVVMHRISHPAGSPQAYSRHRVDVDAPTCGGWPRGDRIYSRDEVGATEGGSSGSLVVNGSGQVVGQLTGACGFDVGDPCNAQDNATVDGAFAAYFDQVAPILDGGGGGCQLGQPGDPCTSNADCCSNKCKGPPSNKTCN